MYTYPTLSPTPTGTPAEVHAFLKSPTLVARRLRTLLDQKFISDFLLRQRLLAEGGAIMYETGETIYAADAPEAVNPGAEYPLTVMTAGELAAAKVVKWGLDTEIYDETIKRLRMATVERTLLKLANSVVRHVDTVALAAIASKVTRTFDATGGGNPGAWTSAEAIIGGVLQAKAVTEELLEGFDLGVVVLKPTQFAKVQTQLLTSGLLPQESGNQILSGTGAFGYLGLTWTTSTFVPVADPMLIDAEQLGGMADEDIQSPGYTKIGNTAGNGGGLVGLETKVNRLNGSDDRDGYRPRARRVTTPVVLEPSAGVRITNTGL